VAHLHVHMEKNGNQAVMKFEKGMTSTGNINDWTRIKGAELPHGKILVWPPRTPSAQYTYENQYNFV